MASITNLDISATPSNANDRCRLQSESESEFESECGPPPQRMKPPDSEVEQTEKKKKNSDQNKSLQKPEKSKSDSHSNSPETEPPLKSDHTDSCREFDSAHASYSASGFASGSDPAVGSGSDSGSGHSALSVSSPSRAPSRTPSPSPSGVSDDFDDLGLDSLVSSHPPGHRFSVDQVNAMIQRRRMRAPSYAHIFTEDSPMAKATGFASFANPLSRSAPDGSIKYESPSPSHQPSFSPADNQDDSLNVCLNRTCIPIKTKESDNKSQTKGQTSSKSESTGSSSNVASSVGEATSVGSKKAHSHHPIEDNAVIGNMLTAAIISVSAKICWYCYPFFDSPSIFGQLLDAEKGGFFSISAASATAPLSSCSSLSASPSDPVIHRQLYHSETNLLVSRFYTSLGVGQVLDYCPVSSDPPLKPSSPGYGWLVRELSVIRGKLYFYVTCLPAFNYGQTPHTIKWVTHNVVLFQTERLSMVLSATGITKRKGGLGEWQPYKTGGARMKVKLLEGQKMTFVFREYKPNQKISMPFNLCSPAAASSIQCRLAANSCSSVLCALDHPPLSLTDKLQGDTVKYWRSWLSQCTYTGRWRESVLRSALALKLMTFEPTGAMVASVTTGIPGQNLSKMGRRGKKQGEESIYDYRLTHIRDSSFVLSIFLQLGFKEEATAFIHFIQGRLVEIKRIQQEKTKQREKEKENELEGERKKEKEDERDWQGESDSKKGGVDSHQPSTQIDKRSSQVHGEKERSDKDDGDIASSKKREDRGESDVMFLSPVYSIHGTADVKTLVLDHWSGYKNIGPLRVGVDPSRAPTCSIIAPRSSCISPIPQLSLYGELLITIQLADTYAEPLAYDVWSHVRQLLNTVCENWKKPDGGMWNGPTKHYVYSKVMSWVALDRGIKVIQKRGYPGETEQLRKVRDEIYSEIMKRGYSSKRRCFVQSFDDDSTIDASALLFPHVGFVSPTDPTFVSTLDQILKPFREFGLTSNNLVFRESLKMKNDRKVRWQQPTRSEEKETRKQLSSRPRGGMKKENAEREKREEGEERQTEQGSDKEHCHRDNQAVCEVELGASESDSESDSDSDSDDESQEENDSSDFESEECSCCSSSPPSAVTPNTCSWWRVESCARVGLYYHDPYLQISRLSFEQMLGYGNHVGLYSEVVGLRGEHLGNFPHVFSHLSLISSALHLDDALRNQKTALDKDQGLSRFHHVMLK